MIEARLRKEIDWNAPDHQARSRPTLFRLMLLDYVSDYLARGDAALMQYHDQSREVRLDDEHQSLLEASLYITDFAPAFGPIPESISWVGTNKRLSAHSINWTKIKFGLKPVTILTHVTTYRSQSGSVSQTIVVSKQLFTPTTTLILPWA